MSAPPITFTSFDAVRGIVPAQTPKMRTPPRAGSGVANNRTESKMNVAQNVAGATLTRPQGNLTKEQKFVFDRLIAGEKKRSIEFLQITPALAAAMLEWNRPEDNRTIRPVRVRQHVSRLKAGKFVLTHQGIAFAKDGRLNDGQHRLTAIVEAETSAPMCVTWGAERAEFQVVDAGASRTAAEILAMQGVTSSAMRAATAGLIHFITSPDHTTLPPQEVADFARTLDGPDMDMACTYGSTLSKITAPSAVALAHYWIATRCPEGLHTRTLLRAFFENMATGEGLSGAKLKLREYLVRGETQRNNGRDTNITRAGIIINAWNSWRANRKTVDLTWNYSVKLPEVR